MKMIATLFVVIAFSSLAFAESGYIPCPVPPTTPGADIDKMAGLWYKTNGAPYSINLQVYFTPREDGDFNFTIRSPYGGKDWEDAIAERTDNQNILNLYNGMSKEIPSFMTLNIVDTDYDNYASVYLCWSFVPGTSFVGEHMNLSRTDYMAADKYRELANHVFDKAA
ncbi:uncharacterized protein LOC107361069 [Tetranychus urticae]|uniref:Uncharacterized protein n=1 Tax=Tetranychus urticae TaxID=32264 RepID=T1K6T1_TETUR|nr:uncharacterized protein LOC107361069 [Tetranychus urticae]